MRNTRSVRRDRSSVDRSGDDTHTFDKLGAMCKREQHTQTHGMPHRKMTFALLKNPSLSDTTMNWDCGKCVLNMCPMFCVWCGSSAASISSRMYMGAGLKRSK